MKMLNKLPQNIKINNKRYFINTDFRVMINFEKTLQGINMIEEQEISIKMYKVLKSFCPVFFETFHKNMKKDMKLLLKQFLWFYSCGGREDYHSGNGKGRAINDIYSYEYDDEYIWSAFFQCFNIDLTEEKLHWWKYKAIFQSLPEECKFERIKSYRAYNGKDKDKKELKKYWKLPLDKELQKQLDKTKKYLMKVSEEVK